MTELRACTACSDDQKLARLGQTIRLFAGFVDDLPAARLRRQRWGPREVLAHIVFWHETYVRTIGALLQGRHPTELSGTFRQLNALAVEQLADLPIATLTGRLRKAQLRLERLAPFAIRRHLRIAIKAGAMDRSVEEFLARVEAPTVLQSAGLTALKRGEVHDYGAIRH